MIPDAAVEAAARALSQPAPYDFESYPQHWMERARIALEAAAPHMLAQAWAAGHESGFWNGRESTGSEEMEFCGVEHAKANNPV